VTADDAAARANARAMSDNEWQAFVTSEAAKAVGAWLQARGKLNLPIHRLSMADLEAMAGAGIARFVVMSSIRLANRPEADQALGWLLRD
jgi:hypothetical protein